ncbi:MAG: hypothetical protein GC165_10875 [Armatimonadetes bacterium]|nr:hypothetical protein [Armatimonadota bacterium]MBS1728374.1 hypothetical protein [Armatimonadota bacterium]
MSYTENDKTVSRAVVSLPSNRVGEGKPNPQKSIEQISEEAKTLNMSCTVCGEVVALQVPIAFGQLLCTCGGELDPVSWPKKQDAKIENMELRQYEAVPINHLLMRRLIACCYRKPAFAQVVINHFRRDWDHARNQEWGIDCELLVAHASQAIVMKGHRSVWPYFVILVASLTFFVSPLVYAILCLPLLILAVWMAAGNTSNEQHWKNYCRSDSYDPSKILLENKERVNKLRSYCDGSQQKNLLFFGGYHPFALLGEEDSGWSQMVDRRKRSDGEQSQEAADLNIDSTEEKIVQSITDALVTSSARNEHRLGKFVASRLSVDEIVLTSGLGLRHEASQFLDKGSPKQALSVEEVEQTKSESNSTSRVYKRVSYYDPVRDLGVMTFFRLAHVGPFTYLESSGTKLLPVVDKFLGIYSDEPTSQELEVDGRGPSWWQALSTSQKEKVAALIIALVFFHLGSACGVALAGAMTSLDLSQLLSQAETSKEDTFLPLLAIVAMSWLPVLIQVFAHHGFMPKVTDEFSEKEPSVFEMVMSLGLAMIHYAPEVKRLELRRKVRILKTTGEWNYSPTKIAFRVWQSRKYSRNEFEATDLLMLRKVNDVAIQEGFKDCLESAGIDTTSFDEGAAIVNNFGIINQSGSISGGAIVRNEKPAKAKPSKKKGAVVLAAPTPTAE